MGNGPGKYEGAGAAAEFLHGLVGEGWCGAEAGSCAESGRWYGLITGAGSPG